MDVRDFIMEKWAHFCARFPQVAEHLPTDAPLQVYDAPYAQKQMARSAFSLVCQDALNPTMEEVEVLASPLYPDETARVKEAINKLDDEQRASVSEYFRLFCDYLLR